MRGRKLIQASAETDAAECALLPSLMPCLRPFQRWTGSGKADAPIATRSCS